MSSDEAFPVVVADLVAEVAEHGAIRLPELLTDELAMRVVRLGEVEGDDAGIVSGDHVLTARRQQLERHAVLSVDRAVDDGEPECHQLVEQSTLRCLGVGERSERIDLAVVRANRREAAARAQRGRVVGRNEPVAAGDELVRARAVRAGCAVGAFHAVGDRQHGHELTLIGQISQPGATAQTRRVVEEQEVLTDRAQERLHALTLTVTASMSRRVGCRRHCATTSTETVRRLVSASVKITPFSGGTSA